MSYGDITATTIDTWLPSETDWVYWDGNICHAIGNVYVMATNPGGYGPGGKITTFGVSDVGVITKTVLDEVTLEPDLSAPAAEGVDTVVVTQIASGMVAVMYPLRRTVGINPDRYDIRIRTYSVATDGTLVLVDTEDTQLTGHIAYIGSDMEAPNLLNVAGNVWALATYEERGDPGAFERNMVVRTFTITPAGAISPMTDSEFYQTYSGASGSWALSMTFHFFKLSATLYALLYSGGTEGIPATIRTFTISSGGVISASVDSEVIDTYAGGDAPVMFHIAGDVYAVIHSGSAGQGNVTTYQIDSVGNITSPAIDTWQFGDASYGGGFPEVFHTGHNKWSLFYRQIYHLDAITFTIADNGTITESGTIVHNFEGNSYPGNILRISDTNYYIIANVEGNPYYARTEIITVQVSTIPALGHILELAFDQSIFTESPTWTDATHYLRSIHTERGRMHDLDRIEAGTAIFELDNQAGDWWRNNTAGVFYVDAGNKEVVKPLTLIRLRGYIDGTYYPLWYGVTEKFNHHWLSEGGYGAIVELNCVDIFKSLARFTLPHQTGGADIYSAELSGTRIGHVLDSLGWPAALRTIDAGQVTVTALAPPTGGTNALQYLQQVAEAEGGIIFQGPDGKIVFQDSMSRQNTATFNTSQATFKDDGNDSKYVLPELVDDDDFIWNGADISNAGFTATVNHPTAQLEQGPRILTRKDSLLTSAVAAYDQGCVATLRYSQSKLRCQNLTIYPAASPADLFPKVFTYDLSTRITFWLNQAASETSPNNPAFPDPQEYHIEAIVHDWAKVPDLWRTRWQLWDVNQYRLFKADGTDGHAGSVDKTSFVSYLDGHDAANGDAAHDDGVTILVGQAYNPGGGPSWSVNRGVIQWDTSGLGAGSSILAAYLAVKDLTATTFDKDFSLYIVPASGVSYGLVVGDYGDLLSQVTDYGHVVVEGVGAAWRVGDVNLIPLSAAGIAAINKTGTTRFGLRTDNDINSVDGDGLDVIDESVSLAGSDATSVFPPRLIVQVALG